MKSNGTSANLNPDGILDIKLQEYGADFTAQKKAALKRIDEEIKAIIRNLSL